MRLKCNLSLLMGREKCSIQDVVNATGLARNTVSGLYHETAKQVHFDTVVKLCGFFHCEIEELFKISEDK